MRLPTDLPVLRVVLLVDPQTRGEDRLTTFERELTEKLRRGAETALHIQRIYTQREWDFEDLAQAGERKFMWRRLQDTLRGGLGRGW